jgi:hypothetical protein
VTAAPGYFKSDSRRTEFAWNDWGAVAAFVGDQPVCRIAVNDGAWPYVVAQTYRFVDGAFLFHFSRSGRLAAALERDPNCTIEIDQIVSLLKAPRADATSAEYRSIVARCTAALSTIDLPENPERAPQRILAVRATIVTLSARKRILEEGGNPAGVAFARYAFPAPVALSQLPPEAFEPRPQ